MRCESVNIVVLEINKIFQHTKPLFGNNVYYTVIFNHFPTEKYILAGWQGSREALKYHIYQVNTIQMRSAVRSYEFGRRDAQERRRRRNVRRRRGTFSYGGRLKSSRHCHVSQIAAVEIKPEGF